MPRVGFEPIVPVFERTKKVHAFDRAATVIGKGKAIPVTGRGGPYGCETSRLPHFLDSRLTDGGEVVSLTRQSPFTHRKYSLYLFLLEAELIPSP
jgi:hypothetical protein